MWPTLATAGVALALAAAAPVVGQGAAQVKILAADDGVRPAQVRRVEGLALTGIERLAPLFPGTPKRRILFVLHSTKSRVPPALLAGLQPGVPGFARLQRDEIHIVLDAIQLDPPNDLRTTVDHELVHILLDQYAGRNGLHVPRWLHEGLAQVLAGSAYLGMREEELLYRVKTRSYIPFRDLERRFPSDDEFRLSLAYGQSFSFVAYLRSRMGLTPLLAAARECSAEAPFREVLARRLGRGLVNYELAWREYILHESGAGFRVILDNCFLLLMVAAVVPLLAFAVARRRNREESMKARMAVQEREEQRLAAMPELHGPPYDPDLDGVDAPDDDEADSGEWREGPRY